MYTCSPVASSASRTPSGERARRPLRPMTRCPSARRVSTPYVAPIASYAEKMTPAVRLRSADERIRAAVSCCCRPSAISITATSHALQRRVIDEPEGCSLQLRNRREIGARKASIGEVEDEIGAGIPHDPQIAAGPSTRGFDPCHTEPRSLQPMQQRGRGQSLARVHRGSDGKHHNDRSSRITGPRRKRKVADVQRVPGGVPDKSDGRDARRLDHPVVPREFASRDPSASYQVTASRGRRRSPPRIGRVHSGCRNRR